MLGHEPKENKDTQKLNKEYDGLHATSVSLVGGNSDGQKLYLEVEMFDGEHTNRFEVEFPIDSKAKDVADYMIGIIEDNPKVPPEIIGMMQKKVFFDAVESGWYWQSGNEKAIRLKDQDHRAAKYDEAQKAKNAKSVKEAKEAQDAQYKAAEHKK
jgi:hypothetical protein